MNSANENKVSEGKEAGQKGGFKSSKSLLRAIGGAALLASVFEVLAKAREQDWDTHALQALALGNPEGQEQPSQASVVQAIELLNAIYEQVPSAAAWVDGEAQNLDGKLDEGQDVAVSALLQTMGLDVDLLKASYEGVILAQAAAPAASDAGAANAPVVKSAGAGEALLADLSTAQILGLGLLGVAVASMKSGSNTDTTAPAAPVISTASTSTTNTTPTIAGTAEAGSTVSIYVGTALVGTTVANASGNFSLTLTESLTDAVHTITAKATDAAGNVSVASAAITITVDTTAPAEPLIALGNGVSDDGADATEAIQNSGVITVNAELGSTVTVTFTDEQNNVVTKTLTGTGAANGVSLSLSDLGSGQEQLDDGQITVKAVAVDALGNTSQEATASFTLKSLQDVSD